MPSANKPPVDVIASALPGSTEEELDETRAKLQRLAADFANFRVRTRREKTDLQTRPLKRFFAELLPVLDNYERAMAHVEANADLDQNTAAESIKGLGMIFAQLRQIVQDAGLKPFVSVGQRFTPHRHEAVDQSFSDEIEAGHIIRETAPGYAYHDEVLRPAKVVVSRGSEEGSILVEFDIEDESTEPDHELPLFSEQPTDVGIDQAEGEGTLKNVTAEDESEPSEAASSPGSVSPEDSDVAATEEEAKGSEATGSDAPGDDY